jgi:YD repeat-containing protein
VDDGSGRTLGVTAPDGASVTRYAYQGNSTTVTDPAGKWKTTTVDAYGKAILVTEPNPAGGANFSTSYTYTPMNQLATVFMTRGGATTGLITSPAGPTRWGS